jgi:hypothetical protein
VRAPGAQLLQIGLEALDALLHPLPGIGLDVVDHGG